MHRLMITKRMALEYLSLDEEAFDKFIKPLVTTLKFDDHILFLVDQIDDAVSELMTSGAVVNPKFKLHIVE